MNISEIEPRIAVAMLLDDVTFADPLRYVHFVRADCKCADPCPVAREPWVLCLN
jgi:hypothetical protein